MNITTYSSHNNIIDNSLKNKNVVCIDVFCSSSTLIGAFSNGLKRILVVDDPTDAPNYKYQLNNDRVLMGGALDFSPITGLDVTDSFSDYSKEIVDGKELIYSNENFAPTLKKSLDSKHLFIGGFVNAKAVAEVLISLNDDIALVCCGTKGCFALEDGLAAGAIINEISKVRPVSLSEYSLVIDLFYKQHENDLLHILEKSNAYKTLMQLEHFDDISMALSQNTYDFVPTLYDNWITVL